MLILLLHPCLLLEPDEQPRNKTPTENSSENSTCEIVAVI